MVIIISSIFFRRRVFSRLVCSYYTGFTFYHCDGLYTPACQYLLIRISPFTIVRKDCTRSRGIPLLYLLTCFLFLFIVAFTLHHTRVFTTTSLKLALLSTICFSSARFGTARMTIPYHYLPKIEQRLRISVGGAKAQRGKGWREPWGLGMVC
ncbi:uncharacterized protein CC84DRAFT_755796 [Paraphaeosphaeria sporulosa]|uniref:Uncharacterized protein n=1 Tax=Paraphaeosphaeria sporulosa TaxID=1460663 RepID=A0A177CHA4_9PLEO|nr:uncharacterized protein CC84DRAFT_755796 [Paraphaeosphaeria sporulosa]OAG06238.1 hypothetical protein CC84DRAFT_755796 [Paraphaeosphaeria sporulosa]